MIYQFEKEKKIQQTDIFLFARRKKNKSRHTFFKKIQVILNIKKNHRRRSRSHFYWILLLTNCTTFLRQLNSFTINCVTTVVLQDKIKENAYGKLPLNILMQSRSEDKIKFFFHMILSDLVQRHSKYQNIFY